MIFKETRLHGVFIIEPEKVEDHRGFFALSWSQRDFAERGLNSQLAECNISFNRKKGILRGLHYQVAPHEQAKLVRCTRGAIYDVALDLRPGSPTEREWVAVELTANNHRMFFIPEGLAHGYQTLTARAEILYQMSEYYHPELARGVRYNDPAFNIEWPIPNPLMLERDRSYPLV
jgi:dTDP-4-dehydrorhamnose 3,5-epimerase